VDAAPEPGLTISAESPGVEDAATRAGAAVLAIGGFLEYGTAAALRSALLQFAHGDTDTVVLDMREVVFLDSTGISLLIQAKQRFDAQGTRFVLRQPSARVTRVLEIAGIDDMFTIER
jgi:anti-sigma B factor antagonist